MRNRNVLFALQNRELGVEIPTACLNNFCSCLWERMFHDALCL